MEARFFSDKVSQEPESETKNEETENWDQESESEAQDEETENLEPVEEESAEDSGQETLAEEGKKISREAQLEKEVKNLRDRLLRTLAEQENTRRIAKRDVEAAKSFAVTSFAKSLLDTSDNLARALEAVPEEEKEKSPVLATLCEGIQLTENGLLKAFEKSGLVKYGESGEPFDPYKHQALFEYPDPEKESGTVGQVMKSGFMLNNRVIRPAEVGVVKK